MRASGSKVRKRNQPPFSKITGPTPSTHSLSIDHHCRPSLAVTARDERSSIYNNAKGAWVGVYLPPAVRWIGDQRPVFVFDESVTFIKGQN